ncbi:hypothetical protein LCGC14_1151310 [marine sediment metagenome]|uniref:Uncharacterized protein n=1 Tax=marine sediment metagenome TaxID=412755 RepID=A0A0F9PDJ8_9ZZZZ
MGRKSRAELLYEEVKEDYEEETGSWIVIYDFPRMKAHSNFWDNVHRVNTLVGEGSLIQNSVYMTPSKRGAVTILKLARHYGAETFMYRAEVMDIE